MPYSINGIDPWSAFEGKRLSTCQEDAILVIKDAEYFEEFNRQELTKEKLDYPSALRIFEGMWKEAISLGVLPSKEPLEGIEVDIRIAEILNHV
jgi:hypothetical protein